jgi:glyoxylate/hydroxypyruvate reductase A
LSAGDIARPIFIDDLIDPLQEQALRAAGINCTRDSAGAVISINRDPAQIPATVRWVHVPFMGVDAMIGRLPANVELLTRTVDGMPERMGQYCATAVMADRWAWSQFIHQQAKGLWRRDFRHQDPGRRAAAILGTGYVGRAAAMALRPHFASIWGLNRRGVDDATFDQVAAWTTIERADSAGAGSANQQRQRNDIRWKQIDTLVVTVPLTAATENLVDWSMLSQLVDAHLILIGRGATVDFEAARQALSAHHLRHLTADVFPVEPPAPGDWVWSHPDVTMTPHICGLNSPDDAVISFERARQQLLAGQLPTGAVELDRGY